VSNLAHAERAIDRVDGVDKIAFVRCTTREAAAGDFAHPTISSLHHISNPFLFASSYSHPDEGMTERRMARRVLRAHPVERA